MVSFRPTWTHLVSPGRSWYHRASLGFTWSRLVAPGLARFTQFHLVSLGVAWFRFVSLGCAWFHISSDNHPAKEKRTVATRPNNFTPISL